MSKSLIITEEMMYIQNRKVVLTNEMAKNFNCSKKTIYRRLKNHNYLRSYNQKGAYLTLMNIPIFDENGLWKYKEAYFSKWQSLMTTIAQLIDISKAGLTAGEIIQIVQVEIYHQLTSCLESGIISCDKTLPRPVYYSNDQQKREKQQSNRKSQILNVSLKTLKLNKDTIIKILVVIAKTPTRSIELIQEKLRSENVVVDENQVNWVLEKYEIKKKASL